MCVEGKHLEMVMLGDWCFGVEWDGDANVEVESGLTCFANDCADHVYVGLHVELSNKDTYTCTNS